MCYNYENLNTNMREELSASEVRAICNKLKRLTLLQCTGGEPFLKEDLFDILHEFTKIANAITIPTNGFLPNKIENVITRLVTQNKNTLIRVALSVDGIGELHDSIRNKQGGFDLLMETFHRLNHLRMRHPNFLITCNTVFTRSNTSQINKIIDYCYDLGVNGHTITYMWGEPKNHRSLVAPLESYKQAISYVYGKKYPNMNLSARIMRMINWLADLTVIDMQEKKRWMISCKSIRKFAVLTPDGNMTPCHMHKKSLGNVRDHQYDIDSILKNKTSRRLIKKIRDTKCFCFVQCNVRNKIVYNVKSLWLLLKYFFQGKMRRGFRAEN